MSIIYNALKKTEEQNPNQPKANKPEAIINKPGEKKNKSQIGIKLIAIVVMLGCMGTLVYFITSQGNAKITGPSINMSLNVGSLFKGSKKQESKSGYVFNPGKYTINGILTSDSKNIAMINGDSYAAESQIDDLTIKEITESKVVFLSPTNEEFTIEID